MVRLRILLFGPPRLEIDGNSVPLGRSKALALLAYLGQQSTPVARDTVLDLLWPTFSPSDARNNLRRELSILKDLLPAGALIADRHTVSLNSEAVNSGAIWIDTREFGEKSAPFPDHPHPAGVSCESCIEAYEAAAELYTNDFLAGFSLPDSMPFDEWQYQQSESLRGELNHILDALVAWYEQQGFSDKALTHARRWVALDPFHEAANRAAMRLYFETEQFNAAIRQYEKLSQLLRDELGSEPESETTELYETIRKTRGKTSRISRHVLPGPPPASTSINLPADTTPFIGRKKELSRILESLQAEQIRLITIAGVGGMGKTRLALEAARRAIDTIGNEKYPDGVFFVPLAPISEAALAQQTIAMGVGFMPGSEGNAAQQLIAYLRPLRALIVIDNLEHLIKPEITGLLSDVLTNAPGIKILATSRARLGISSEYVFSLDGLSFQQDESALDSDDSLTAPLISDAVRLFAETARRISPSFSLDETNIEPIMRICELVDGMPLGLELAAAWIELLTPDAIEIEIRRSLDFLSSINTDVAERQSSLKAVFDSSWGLLSQEEQSVLAKLSIFSGTFEREAAETIAGASLRSLLSLRNKSWLQPVGANRYQIHPLLRQFLALELAQGETTESMLRDRHAEFMVGMLEKLNNLMRGPKSGEAFEKINDEIDNLIAALLWLVGNNRLDIVVDHMAIPLLRYLESRYRYFLFQPIIIEAGRRAEISGDTRTLGIFLTFQGAFFFNGYPTRIMDYIWVDRGWQALMRAAWEQLPADGQQVSYWDIIVSWHYGRFVELEAGEQRLRGVIKQLQVENRRWEEAFARQNLGRLLTRRGGDAAEESAQFLQAALEMFEALGDEREAAITLSFLGYVHQSIGNLQEAERILLSAQTRLRAIGETITAVNLNWQLADIYLIDARFKQALASYDEMAETLIGAGLSQLAISILSRESYESVRYGDLNQALQLREKAMSLSVQRGNRFTEAWDCWELAETYRVMEKSDEARLWNERARQKFMAQGISDIESFYHRLLGDLALAEGNHVEATSHFHETIKFADESNHPWQHAYGLIGLGTAAVLESQFDKASDYLIEAIRIAHRTGDPGGLVLLGVIRAARLFKMEGDDAEATRLANLVLSHPLSWQETRREAANILGMNEEAIPLRVDSRPTSLLPIIEQIFTKLLRTN